MPTTNNANRDRPATPVAAVECVEILEALFEPGGVVLPAAHPRGEGSPAAEGGAGRAHETILPKELGSGQ